MKLGIFLITLGVIGMITSLIMIVWSYFSKGVKKKKKVIVYKQKKIKDKAKNKKENNIKPQIDNDNDDTMLLNNSNDNDDTILLK